MAVLFQLFLSLSISVSFGELWEYINLCRIESQQLWNHSSWLHGSELRDVSKRSRGIKAQMNHSSTLIHSNLCSVHLKSFFLGASRCLYQSCADSGWIWFNCCDVDLIGAVLSFRLIFSPAIAFQLITLSQALLANEKCIWLPCHSPSRKPSMVVSVLVSNKLYIVLLIYSSIQNYNNRERN